MKNVKTNALYNLYNMKDSVNAKGKTMTLALSQTPGAPVHTPIAFHRNGTVYLIHSSAGWQYSRKNARKKELAVF